eukprot:CFRG1642T1
MDNRASTSSQTNTEKYTVGYAETESTKTATGWTTEAGVTFKAATVNGGYSSTVDSYDSIPRNTSEQNMLEIASPAGFETNCYTNTQNLTEAESFCPVDSATTSSRRESENINGIWYHDDVPSAKFSGVVREENTDDAGETD